MSGLPNISQSLIKQHQMKQHGALDLAITSYEERIRMEKRYIHIREKNVVCMEAGKFSGSLPAHLFCRMSIILLRWRLFILQPQDLN